MLRHARQEKLGWKLVKIQGRSELWELVDGKNPAQFKSYNLDTKRWTKCYLTPQ